MASESSDGLMSSSSFLKSITMLDTRSDVEKTGRGASLTMTGESMNAETARQAMPSEWGKEERSSSSREAVQTSVA